jgi:DDE superfamily endonuclease
LYGGTVVSGWRLFVPGAWDRDGGGHGVAERRRRAAMPDEAVHHEKWRLALDMIDEAASWGLVPPLIVADAGYSDAAESRQALVGPHPASKPLSWPPGAARAVGSGGGPVPAAAPAGQLDTPAGSALR